MILFLVIFTFACCCVIYWHHHTIVKHDPNLYTYEGLVIFITALVYTLVVSGCIIYKFIHI